MIDNATNITSLVRQAAPEVVDAIRQASSSTGVDFSYLLQKAATESSFDTDAQAATSSARGLYQFIDRTWLDTIDKHGAEHGLVNAAEAITRDSNGNPTVADAATRQQILALRDDPRVAAMMAAEFARDNQASLEQSLGRKVGNTELYLAHFLGAGGAARFLGNLADNPASNAAQLMPSAARANQAVFYQGGKSLSVDQVFARFADKFGDEARASAPPRSPAAIFAAATPNVAGRLPPHTVNDLTTPSEISATHTTAPATAFQGHALPRRIPMDSLPLFAMRILESLSLPGDSTSETSQDWHV